MKEELMIKAQKKYKRKNGNKEKMKIRYVLAPFNYFLNAMFDKIGSFQRRHRRTLPLKGNVIRMPLSLQFYAET